MLPSGFLSLYFEAVHCVLGKDKTAMWENGKTTMDVPSTVRRETAF